MNMLHNARHIFYLLRPVNLLIVTISQILVYYIVILPLLISQSISPVLGNGKILWFILVTLCITASGYIINDIFDKDVDQYNKPDKMIITKHLSIQQGWFLYGILIGIGLLVAFGIAITINKVWLTLLYPLAVILLLIYSKWWKHQSLKGNIVVALFCMFVPGILWYAECESIKHASMMDPKNGNTVQYALIFYCFFAFVSTLIREVIKDIEDLEGDKLGGSQHFVITAGTKNAKSLVFILTGVLLIGIALFIVIWSQEVSENIAILGGMVFLFLPSWLLIRQMLTAQYSSQFGKASFWAKIWMAGGLFYLLLIHIIKW